MGDDKVVLTSHFTSDGIQDYAVVILCLPLYLSNALKNKCVGILRALRILVEILKLLYRYNLDTGGTYIANVDMKSFADFTEQVHSGQEFENSVEFLRIFKVRKR